MVLTPAHLIVPGMPGFFGVRKPKAAGGGGGSFTPASLSSLVGWWDASDSGTITDDGSGNASQWNDKSSNGNHLTPQSTGKPTINASDINGLDTLTFAASTGMQKLAASGLPGSTTGIGMAAVLLPTNLNTKIAFSLGNHTSVGLEAALLLFNSTTANLRTRNIDSASATVSYTDNTNPHLLSGTCSNLTRDIYKDGTQGTPKTVSEASEPSTDIAIGHQLGGGNTIDFVGKFCELVLFSGASSTDRQKLEGYLAWKWGLQGNLPAGHPYKSAAP